MIARVYADNGKVAIEDDGEADGNAYWTRRYAYMDDAKLLSEAAEWIVKASFGDSPTELELIKYRREIAMTLELYSRAIERNLGMLHRIEEQLGN